MGRDAERDVTDEADFEDVDARVPAEVDKNGFAVVKVRYLIAKPFAERG
jgi:hypothetical protein